MDPHELDSDVRPRSRSDSTAKLEAHIGDRGVTQQSETTTRRAVSARARAAHPGSTQPGELPRVRLASAAAADLKIAIRKTRTNIDRQARPQLPTEDEHLRHWVRETHTLAKSTNLKDVRRVLRNISPEAFFQFRKTFAMMDRDSDGQVSRDELQAVLLGYNIHCTPDEVDGIFAEIDVHRSAGVTFDEFLRVVSARARSAASTAFRWIVMRSDTLSGDERRIADIAHSTHVSYRNVGALFQRFVEMDIDSSGTISKTEFDELVRLLIPEADDVELHEWWRFIDVDRDRSVTFEEFMVRWVKLMPSSVEFKDHDPEIMTFRHIRNAVHDQNLNFTDEHILLMMGLGGPHEGDPTGNDTAELGVTLDRLEELVAASLNEKLRTEKDPLAEILCSLQATFITRETLTIWREMALAMHRAHKVLSHLRFVLLEDAPLDPDLLATLLDPKADGGVSPDLSATDCYRHNHTALHYVAWLPHLQGDAPDIARYAGKPFALWPVPTSPVARAAKMLIEAKAEVDATNDFGWTPLYVAIEQGNVDVVSILLKYGDVRAMLDQYVIEVSSKVMTLRTSDPRAVAISEMLNLVVGNAMQELRIENGVQADNGADESSEDASNDNA